MKCLNCGQELSENASFCGICGSKVNSNNIASDNMILDNNTSSNDIVNNVENNNTTNSDVINNVENNNNIMDKIKSLIKNTDKEYFIYYSAIIILLIIFIISLIKGFMPKRTNKLFKEDKSTISFSIDKDKFNIGDKYSKFTSLGYYSNNSDYTIKYDSIIVDTIYKNGKAYLLATLYCPNKTGCKYEDSILMKANLYNNSSVTVNDKINYNMSYDAVVKVLNKPIGVLNQDSSYYVWATGKNVGDKYIFIKFSYGLFSYGISEIRVGTWWYKGEFEHVVKEGVPNEK